MENSNTLVKPQLYQYHHFMYTFYTFKQIQNMQGTSRASKQKFQLAGLKVSLPETVLFH